MSDYKNKDPILDMFIFETLELTEALEQCILSSEQNKSFEAESINEIFRIMHTLKGNAAMMMFENISTVAHAAEDLFDYLRKETTKELNYKKITDLVLSALDFIRIEVSRIEEETEVSDIPKDLIDKIDGYLKELKNSIGEENIDNKIKEVDEKLIQQSDNFFQGDNIKEPVKNEYKALVNFQEECGMENVRAFTLVNRLKEVASIIKIYPEDIAENNDTEKTIKEKGFEIFFASNLNEEELKDFFYQTPFLKEIKLRLKEEEILKNKFFLPEETPSSKVSNKSSSALNQKVLSVNVSKLDLLMDLVGELVISESMVTNNRELEGLHLDNFYKSSRQLRKIISSLQDVVMSMRMVPIAIVFNKMNRLVRDASKKLNKELVLEVIGEETEVDKNIIENLSDPLMHIIRNSMDHGIETSEERISLGKPKEGKITLEAKNSGGEVWIIVRDDGRGLDKEKILKKAKEHGLLSKSEKDLTDKEIYSFIFLPGFSTKETISEFSGRGVGMDVVQRNIEKIRGTILVDSIPKEGTTISIKIPLTLAIIDGMTVKVGTSRYTIPIIAIKEAIKIQGKDIIRDLEGNEIILIRGQSFSVLRLHQLYKVDTEVKNITEGIIVMVEYEGKALCLFVDQLIGESQVVVKALPNYIKKIKGIAGCTLLGDGNISLILDIAALIN